MLRWLIRFIGCVFLIFSASLASAAPLYQISGSTDVDGVASFSVSMAAPPPANVSVDWRVPAGTYVLKLETSPTADALVDVQELYDFSLGYNNNDGSGWHLCFWCGEDFFEWTDLAQTAPGVYSEILRIQPYQRYLYGDFQQYNDGTIPPGAETRLEFDKDVYNASIFISASAPTGYTFSITSVPEPAAWLLMVAGFATVGVALRTAKPAARRRWTPLTGRVNAPA